MAFVEQAHVNDIGTVFRVTVYDTTSTGGTTVADISLATTKQFTFKRPDGTTFDRTAVFTPVSEGGAGSPGTDGNIQYLSVDGDLMLLERGIYRLTWLRPPVTGKQTLAISKYMKIYKVGDICLGK